ncbi:MAG: DUF2817 domain-containing protein, partial [Phycisphaerales bacterium]
MNGKRLFTLVVSIFTAIFILAGCYQSTVTPELVTTSPSQSYPETAIYSSGHQIVGKSVNGLPIISFVLGQGPDVTFILATIHGDEPAGTPLVRYLREYLQEHPSLMKGRTVVLLAVANPDGMALNSRFNANGVDINRNFETDNRVNNKRFGTTAF